MGNIASSQAWRWAEYIAAGLTDDPFLQKSLTTASSSTSDWLSGVLDNNSIGSSTHEVTEPTDSLPSILSTHAPDGANESTPEQQWINQVADSITHTITTHGGLLLDVGSALPGPAGVPFSSAKVLWDINHGDMEGAKIDALMGALSATGLDAKALHLAGTGLSTISKTVLHYMQTEGGIGASIVAGGSKEVLTEGEKTAEKTLENGNKADQGGEAVYSPDDYEELNSVGAAANKTGGLPPGFKRVTNKKTGETVIVSDNGHVYKRASDIPPEFSAGTSSKIVPGGGLPAHEGPGHLMARHVGKTEEYLEGRLAKTSSKDAVMSTFADRATAERAVSEAMESPEAIEAIEKANKHR